jgi:hypothetical protein
MASGAAPYSDVRHFSAAELARRYFAGRADGPRNNAEELLVATA